MNKCVIEVGDHVSYIGPPNTFAINEFVIEALENLSTTNRIKITIARIK